MSTVYPASGSAFRFDVVSVVRQRPKHVHGGQPGARRCDGTNTGPP